MQVNAKCTNCGENILIDDNKEAFITEKAIKLYKESVCNEVSHKVVKKKHVWKSLGKGLLKVLECVGYLFYCLFFVWLFVDITNDLKKK